MLALEAKVEMQGWQVPALLKVARLKEFSQGKFPLENMILDIRSDPEIISSESILALPWAGFLSSDGVAAPSGRPSLKLLGDQAIAQAGDVIEVKPSVSKVAVRYRRGDNGNVLFATERCNSFCLMCSQPPRQIEDDWRVSHLCELARLIDKEEASIAISGGEPTLLGDGLTEIIKVCADALPDTHVHVLSNGRNFESAVYADKFKDLHPSLTWGVPLYGDHFRLHDYIVQSSGAFAETIKGLYALHAAGQRIEIRVVLVKPTVERLSSLVRYIYQNLPFVEHVALMGIEPIGFAKAHHEALWIDPVDMAGTLYEAVSFLDQRGISVSLYNLPLCTLPDALRPFARRSISNWKQDYLPACAECDIKSDCGGFFGWITPEWTSRGIKQVKVEEQVCARH